MRTVIRIRCRRGALSMQRPPICCKCFGAARTNVSERRRASVGPRRPRSTALPSVPVELMLCPPPFTPLNVLPPFREPTHWMPRRMRRRAVGVRRLGGCDRPVRSTQVRVRLRHCGLVLQLWAQPGSGLLLGIERIRQAWRRHVDRTQPAGTRRRWDPLHLPERRCFARVRPHGVRRGILLGTERGRRGRIRSACRGRCSDRPITGLRRHRLHRLEGG